MAVLIDKSTRLIVQGLTGREGTFHAKAAAAYGTNVVGGVTPGKGGTEHEGLPVFNTVADAVREDRRQRLGDLRAAAVRGRRHHGGDRRRHRADRLHHRGHPGARHDEGPALHEGQEEPPHRPQLPRPHHRRDRPRPASSPGHICTEGRVGIVSKSGTLTYEAIHQLTKLGLGQTTCIGIGGDPLIGTTFIDALELFAKDDQTEAVVMIGEIGGSAEQEAAAWIQANFKKPVVGFIAGQTAPPGRRMGHAGAIISGGKGTADEKMTALAAAGVTVVKSPADIGAAIASRL